MTSYTPVQLAFNSAEPEESASGKPPIIFLHGLTASKENWNDLPQIVANATKRKVYAVDARNHGDSEWTDVYNFDCNLDDLLNFMDSIKAPKAIIVGHSMGGITGIKAALRAPERIEKLIVEDMGVRKLPQEVFDTILNFISLGQAAIQQVPVGADEDAAQKCIMEFIYSHLPEDVKKLTKGKSTDIKIPLKRMADGSYSYKSNISVIEKVMKNSKDIMLEHTGLFEGSASFIYGALSPFLVGKAEQEIRKFFPNADLIAIEDATHTVHSDCPKEFTETLLNCLLK